MRTEQALHEFIASCIAANLSPATMQWYNDRLFPFARSCPTLRRRPEPVECFLAEVQGSPKTKYDVFRVLKTSFKFRGAAAGVCPTPWMPSSPHAAPRHSCRHSKVGELMRLLHSSESTRDRAIITLLVDCGVRAGEVCSLLKHNIKQETIIFMAK